MNIFLVHLVPLHYNADIIFTMTVFNYSVFSFGCIYFRASLLLDSKTRLPCSLQCLTGQLESRDTDEFSTVKTDESFSLNGGKKC